MFLRKISQERFPFLQEVQFGVFVGVFLKFLNINFSPLIPGEVRKQFQVASVVEEDFTWVMIAQALSWRRQIWYRIHTVYQKAVNSGKSWKRHADITEGCPERNFVGKKITAKILFVIPPAPSPALFLLTLHLVVAGS